MDNKNQFSLIGKYEVKEKIGEGGFGIVYRARDPMLDREVAIKVLRADIASSPDFVERFRREARLAASMRHPNIATIIEVGEHEGRYFLVMDYLSGGSLDSYLEKMKPLSLMQTVELISPLADALDHAHSKGIIHRDVKPSNVILDEEGRPILTDFGLVKSLFEQNDTTTGIVLGTAEYMAPEQVLGKDLSPATDVYALGVIVYHMLIGKVPFSGNTPFEIQNGHVNQTPSNPSSINSNLPYQLDNILLKVLSKDPLARPKSAREFISELKSIVDEIENKELDESKNKALELMDEYKFDQAIEELKRINSIYLTDELQEMISECYRRKELWYQINILRDKKDEINQKIASISNNEAWLKRIIDKNGESHSYGNDNNPISNKWLFVLLITLSGVITVIFNTYGNRVHEALYYSSLVIMLVLPYSLFIKPKDKAIIKFSLIIALIIPILLINPIAILVSTRWIYWPGDLNWWPLIPFCALYFLVVKNLWNEVSIFKKNDVNNQY